MMERGKRDWDGLREIGLGKERDWDGGRQVGWGEERLGWREGGWFGGRKRDWDEGWFGGRKRLGWREVQAGVGGSWLKSTMLNVALKNKLKEVKR